MITLGQLTSIYPFSSNSNRVKYLDFLNKYMEFYEINTPIRKKMFLAQIGHESGQLRYCEEIASGEAYDTGNLAKRLGNTPEKDGDGQKYKGRGLIQITGQGNYEEISKAFGIDFLSNPTLLSSPEYAVKSACWWWNKHGLNELSDKGDVRVITKRINGGYNGLADRTHLFSECKKFIQ